MFRWLTMVALVSVAVSAVAQAKPAQDCCDEKKPIVAQQAKQAKQDDCCAEKKPIVAKQAKQDDCCAEKPMASEEAFMAEAKRMMVLAEVKASGKAECCQSTPAKPMAKGDEGCCNADGAPAKFKVFVAGEGYKFFGCADSASEGRTALSAEGRKVGPVQKVSKTRSL